MTEISIIGLRELLLDKKIKSIEYDEKTSTPQLVIEVTGGQRAIIRSDGVDGNDTSRTGLEFEHIEPAPRSPRKGDRIVRYVPSGRGTGIREAVYDVVSTDEQGHLEVRFSHFSQ